MTYPEPASRMQRITSGSLTEAKTTALLLTEAGTGIEVQHLARCGWSIEVRYDQTFSGCWRQPYTGAQALLTKSELTIADSATEIAITVGDEKLSVQKSSGQFSIFNSEKKCFESGTVPFASHEQPVTLFEQLMSRKVTDLTGRTFGNAGNIHYQTRMVRFQYPRPEGAVLGLAGQTGELNRNGYRFELYNTDEFVHTPARKPMYQSWPILFHRALSTDRWIAVFHDNPARTFVDIGDFYEDRVTFESITNNSRVYICVGKSLAEVSAQISRLLGGMSLPPLWAFGYQQCRWSYLSTDEVRSVVTQMRAAEIPLDAIYFDIDYMDGYRVFTNNPKQFGDFAACVAELRSHGVHSVAIVDPGVKAEPGYTVYDQIRESGAYLTLPDGEALPAKVWPGDVILPDFGDENLREIWSDLERDWLRSIGLAGIWNDMNEPSNFAGGNPATAKSVTARGPFLQESNLYGYYMAQTSALGWDKAHPNERGVIITRAGYPGVQRDAVIWHGDNQAWWEHLRLAIDTTLAYSISGAYYTGPDVPGFTGNPPDDLAVRFFQLGAFLPLFRGHSIFFAKDKEPYAFAPKTRALIRDAIHLRYSLLREWYSGFERAIREHRAPIMPIFSESGSLVRDQFLLFDSLLVAPVIERDQERRLVYLPEGDWYPLGSPSSRPLSGNNYITLAVSLDSMPVFVRAGITLTRNTPGRTAAETLGLPEHAEVYPDRNGTAQPAIWYSDDGITRAR